MIFFIYGFWKDDMLVIELVLIYLEEIRKINFLYFIFKVLSMGFLFIEGKYCFIN